MPADVILVLADIDLLHHSRPLTTTDRIITVTVPVPTQTSTPATAPPNTIMIVPDQAGDVAVECRTGYGHILASRAEPLREILHGLAAGPAIGRIGDGTIPARDLLNYTPVVCGLQHAGSWHTYSRTHQTSQRWCFIRTNPEPLTPPNTSTTGWIDDALRHHSAYVELINSNHCITPPGFRGREVEVKFTLPPDTPIWPLATEMHRLLHAGNIPAMVPRIGLDFEMRDYDNHLFEIIAPEAERGYVSFMGLRGSRYRIKRKTFTMDALVRPETVSGDIDPGMPLQDYVSDILHLDARPLAPFRRIRYDLMLESTATGNHFSILLDRSTLIDQPGRALVQCELEYMRARRILPISEAEVLAEFESLQEWIAQFLTERNIPSNLGYYSKLSFLRDVRAWRGRPGAPVIPTPDGVTYSEPDGHPRPTLDREFPYT